MSDMGESKSGLGEAASSSASSSSSDDGEWSDTGSPSAAAPAPSTGGVGMPNVILDEGSGMGAENGLAAAETSSGAGPRTNSDILQNDLNLDDDEDDDDDVIGFGLIGEEVSDDDFDLSNSGSNSRFVDGSAAASVAAAAAGMMGLNTPEIDLEGAINSVLATSSNNSDSQFSHHHQATSSSQASAGFSATAFIREELDDVSEEASLPEVESDSTAVATEMTREEEGKDDSSHITSLAVTIEDSKTLDRQAVSIRSIKVEPEPGEEENNAGAIKNPPLPPNEAEVAPAPPPEKPPPPPLPPSEPPPQDPGEGLVGKTHSATQQDTSTQKPPPPPPPLPPSNPSPVIKSELRGPGDEDDDDSMDSMDEDELESMLNEGHKASQVNGVDQEPAGKGGSSETTIDHTIRKKTFLVERGEDHFQVLPYGWIRIRHNSGMPIYLHGLSRVVSISRPYNIGPHTIARKHRIPYNAIPCLNYKRALESEKKAREDLDKEPPASAQNASSESEGKTGEPGDTTPTACPVSGTAPPQLKDNHSETHEKTAQNTTKSGDDSQAKGENQANPSPKCTDDQKVRQGEQPHPPRRPHFPKARISTVAQARYDNSISAYDFKEYCRKVFELKDVEVKKFNNWKEKRLFHKRESEKRKAECLEAAGMIPAAKKSRAAAAGGDATGSLVEAEEKAGGKCPFSAGDKAETTSASDKQSSDQTPENDKGDHTQGPTTPGKDQAESNHQSGGGFASHRGSWRGSPRGGRGGRGGGGFSRFDRRVRPEKSSLPDGVKVITIPVMEMQKHNESLDDTAFNRRVTKKSRKDWVFNPKGKSAVCILHEYLQQSIKKPPEYEYTETESAATPYSATVSIDGVVHGKGLGSSKKHAKTEACRQTLEILIPDFKETLGEDIAGATNSSSTALNELPDVSFFDPYRIEDPRIADLCQRVGEPSPYAILMTCLQKNRSSWGDTNIETNLVPKRNKRNEFTMSVKGKGEVTVICKNKRDGKQMAAQKLLQVLHPHLRSWSKVLALYGSRSIQAQKLKKVKESEVTSLQSKNRAPGQDGERAKGASPVFDHSPSQAILDKLKLEMKKLAEQKRLDPDSVLGKLSQNPLKVNPALVNSKTKHRQTQTEIVTQK